MRPIHSSLLTGLASICLHPVAAAKPMEAPTLERALASSPLIVEACFQGHGDASDVTYFGGIGTRWVVQSVWKGSWGDEGEGKMKPMPVRWDWNDGSACEEPTGWSFSSDMLPKPGERYLLFLRPEG